MVVCIVNNNTEKDLEETGNGLIWGSTPKLSEETEQAMNNLCTVVRVPAEFKLGTSQLHITSDTT
jgi:hypothetical protein